MGSFGGVEVLKLGFSMCIMIRNQLINCILKLLKTLDFMRTRLFYSLLMAVYISLSTTSNAQDSSQVRKPAELTIYEAIDLGILELRITGAYDPRIFMEVVDQEGVHFGKCMAIVLKSKIDSIVFVRLDCGIQLIPDDTTVQTMIVTKKAIFPLYPNEMYATKFYAMCGQIHDASPIMETTFKVGEMGDSGLVKLASYLGEHFIQNMPGQHALWAYTDQVDTTELIKYGADSISLALTTEILKSVDLETKLTSIASEPVPTKESNLISIHRYYLYAGIALIVVLVGLVVWRRRGVIG